MESDSEAQKETNIETDIFRDIGQRKKKQMDEPRENDTEIVSLEKKGKTKKKKERYR